MAEYREWIKNIDVDIDYFSAYIKAWIAFNSWYRVEYPNGSDRAIIEIIKNDTNKFKTYICNFLSGTDETSILFQERIGKLHYALSNAAITTQERGGLRIQISFNEIAINNRDRKADTNYRHCEYKSEWNGNKLKSQIYHKKRCVDIFVIEQDNYDIDELSMDSRFLLLTNEQQQQCLANYRGICPYKTENILSSGEFAKKMGEYNFVDDNNKISRGIVEILYLLRCSLMHGELSPDNNAKLVYQYAYEILRMILKKLI